MILKLVQARLIECGHAVVNVAVRKPVNSGESNARTM